jgi:hypothetical protein
MSFTSNETPSPNSDIPLINLSIDPHAHWSAWNENLPAELFTVTAEEEVKRLKKEEDKERLTMFIMDSIDGEGSDLSGEEVFDCFKSGISSAYDYAKKEYEKFKYLAEKFGIE